MHRESFRKLTFRALALRHSPFLDAFGKLAAIFATFGCFEEPYGDFPTLEERSIQHFGVLLQSVIILFPNNMLSKQHVVLVLVLPRTNESLTIFGCLWEVCGDFR